MLSFTDLIQDKKSVAVTPSSDCLASAMHQGSTEFSVSSPRASGPSFRDEEAAYCTASPAEGIVGAFHQGVHVQHETIESSLVDLESAKDEELQH